MVTDPIHIINLGAGVQSSTLALMAAAGEVGPMPTAAIFADTGAEPAAVYLWLDWLESQLPFPVYRVNGGNLEEEEGQLRRSKRSGNLYMRTLIPAWVANKDGSFGILGRKCTRDFKITPILKKVRELTGVKRQGKGVVRAVQWVGISTDEAHRMKPSGVDYTEHRWPLIERRMTRKDCLVWMQRRGFPEPPRSACVFCPFHGDHEWKRLKEEAPEEFARAVAMERRLQKHAAMDDVTKGVPFLKKGNVPIDEVVFKDAPSHEQLDLFGNECEGLCGV